MQTNSNNTKKIIEKEHLLRFLSSEVFDIPINNIQESESPDFIIKMNSKQISIEHSRLIIPDLKKIERYRDKIINRAHKKFKKKYPNDLYVLITFDKSKELLPGEKFEKKYADEVFDLVEKLYFESKKKQFQVNLKKNNFSKASMIDSIYINGIKNHDHWQHFGAFLVEHTDVDWLKKRIAKKETNLRKYKNKFDENWLLLVSNLGTKASSHRFDRIYPQFIKTNFDKIFLYSFRSNNVKIIK